MAGLLSEELLNYWPWTDFTDTDFNYKVAVVQYPGTFSFSVAANACRLLICRVAVVIKLEVQVDVPCPLRAVDRCCGGWFSCCSCGWCCGCRGCCRPTLPWAEVTYETGLGLITSRHQSHDLLTSPFEGSNDLSVANWIEGHHLKYQTLTIFHTTFSHNVPSSSWTDYQEAIAWCHSHCR